MTIEHQNLPDILCQGKGISGKEMEFTTWGGDIYADESEESENSESAKPSEPPLSVEAATLHSCPYVIETAFLQ